MKSRYSRFTISQIVSGPHNLAHLEILMLSTGQQIRNLFFRKQRAIKLLIQHQQSFCFLRFREKCKQKALLMKVKKIIHNNRTHPTIRSIFRKSLLSKWAKKSPERATESLWICSCLQGGSKLTNNLIYRQKTLKAKEQGKTILKSSVCLYQMQVAEKNCQIEISFLKEHQLIESNSSL